jgi:hypothetical protein
MVRLIWSFACSLIWIDRRFVFRLDFVSFPPLPIVVAVVIDFLDGNRGF